MYKTPIHALETDIDGIELYIKRDDLLYFSFGGNKARISEEYFLDMKSKDKDCIIGYGNEKSNLCRVLSNMSSAKNYECHIISPIGENDKNAKSYNSILVDECKGRVHKCAKNEVADTIGKVIEGLLSQGKKPYYINGDKYGKGNEATPVRAYAKAYDEIRQQSLEELNFEFDYIFLATGTGMTQAGLVAGRQKNKGNEQIIGVSIARSADVCKEMISRYVKAYLMNDSFEEKIQVIDDYLCGGYAQYNHEIEESILRNYTQNGVPMDPTYTGKAFYGMCEYLKKNKISNKRVLFLHTGGTPLFFDFLKHRTKKYIIEKCNDLKSICDFLEKVDKLLPVPLSERVDLLEYAKKIITNGKALVIRNDEMIIAGTFFYCNDAMEKNAYLTLLSTLPAFEGKGCAQALMLEMENECRRNGMQRIHLDTELTNKRAISLYSKNGYQITQITPKVHMVKEL